MNFLGDMTTFKKGAIEFGSEKGTKNSNVCTFQNLFKILRPQIRTLKLDLADYRKCGH